MKDNKYLFKDNSNKIVKALEKVNQVEVDNLFSLILIVSVPFYHDYIIFSSNY